MTSSHYFITKSLLKYAECEDGANVSKYKLQLFFDKENEKDKEKIERKEENSNKFMRHFVENESLEPLTIIRKRNLVK